MRKYSVWFKHNGEMKEFSAANTEEFALELISSQAITFGKPGSRYEVRNQDGKVIHRIEVQMVYTVNPND